MNTEDPYEGGLGPGSIILEVPPEAPEAGELAAGAITPFSEHQARFGIFLLSILAGSILIVAALYATMCVTHIQADDVRDYGALIVGPIITLVASVIGFYFGERRRG